MCEERASMPRWDFEAATAELGAGVHALSIIVEAATDAPPGPVGYHLAALSFVLEAVEAQVKGLERFSQHLPSEAAAGDGEGVVCPS